MKARGIRRRVARVAGAMGMRVKSLPTVSVADGGTRLYESGAEHILRMLQ